LAVTIHKYNLQQQTLDPKDQKIIPLKAALIGDPFVSPIRQRMAVHKIAESTGILDSIHMRQIAALRRNCENVASTNWVNINDVCGAALDYMGKMSAGVYPYDATRFGYEIYPDEAPFNLYLSANNPKSKELYDALHIS
jgi:hypothetical protein